MRIIFHSFRSHYHFNANLRSGVLPSNRDKTIRSGSDAMRLPVFIRPAGTRQELGQRLVGERFEAKIGVRQGKALGHRIGHGDAEYPGRARRGDAVGRIFECNGFAGRNADRFEHGEVRLGIGFVRVPCLQNISSRENSRIARAA